MAIKPRKSRAAPAVSKPAANTLETQKSELAALKLNWTNTKSGHDRMLMEPRIKELEKATRGR